MNIIQINDINEPTLDLYARYSEASLMHCFEPAPGLFIAESPNVIIRAALSGYKPHSLLVETQLIEKEAVPVFETVKTCFGEDFAEALPIYTADRNVLKELTGYALVRGLWGAFYRKEVPEIKDFLKDKKRIAVLCDIVNPTNVGAITRCAAALDMDGMITTFDTVNPLYRRSARVSMGTVFQIPWTVAPKSAENGKNLIAVLKEAGFTTAAMALTDVSLPVNDPGIRDHEKIAVVLGTEGYGLPDEVIAACDFAIKIPMYHGVDSLNVAAAAAVCFWELIR